MDYRDLTGGALLLLLLTVAAAEDLRSQRIPNWLTFSSMLLAMTLHAAWSSWQGLLFSLGGIAVGIATLLLPYLLGGMGAGDAKLMGAVGGFLGPEGVFFAFLFSALAGGVYAFALILFCGNFKVSFTRYGSMARTLLFTGKWIYLPPGESERKPRLRYGAAIALGTILSVLWREGLLGWDLTRTFV